MKRTRVLEFRVDLLEHRYGKPIMNIVGWMNSNAGALQSIAAIVSVVLSIVTIGVLIVTWRAIREQAEAARELTKVARQQTKAAVDSAEAAQKQSALLSDQMEQATSPLLVCEPDDRDGYKCMKLVNRGQGVAFQAFYWKGGFDEKEKQSTGLPIIPIQPSTLGTGNSTYLPVPPAWDVITVRYKGISRQERWTLYYKDPKTPQQHIVQRGFQQVSLS